MNRALHAEWTKLRTVAGTGWLLAGVVALTVTLSVAAAGATACPAGCPLDPAKVGLTGLEFGQAVVVILGVLAVSGEYATGMIHTSLIAVPRRTTVLTAKAAVVGALTLAAAAVAVLASVLVSRPFLRDNGFGAQALSLADGPVLRAVAGSVLYLVLIGLLSVGVATVVRDSALAIGLVLGLLYLFPIVATVFADPDWVRNVLRISPMMAGLAVRATVDLQNQPITPWAGLGVLAAWAASALFAGGLLLRLRDA